jgi:hypothetical protein
MQVILSIVRNEGDRNAWHFAKELPDSARVPAVGETMTLDLSGLYGYEDARGRAAVQEVSWAASGSAVVRCGDVVIDDTRWRYLPDTMTHDGWTISGAVRIKPPLLRHRHARVGAKILGWYTLIYLGVLAYSVWVAHSNPHATPVSVATAIELYVLIPILLVVFAGVMNVLGFLFFD